MNTDKGTSRITSSAVVMHEMAALSGSGREKVIYVHAKQRDDLAKLLSNQVSIREEDESDSSSSSSSHSLSDDDDDDEEAEAAQQPKSVAAPPRTYQDTARRGAQPTEETASSQVLTR